MSNFPTELDDDVTLPRADDNVTEIRGDIINALRHAIFNIQKEIGIGASGSSESLAKRINASLDPNGNINPSVVQLIINSIGGISDKDVAPNANISESKLNLDYPTSDLNASLLALKADTERSLSFISIYGSKIQPHIEGQFPHTLSHIRVEPDAEIKNRNGVIRGSSYTSSSVRNNSLFLLKDFNSDFVSHQKLQGMDSGGYYAHYAAGIGLDAKKFSYIGKEVKDLQSLADFIDSNTLSLLGTRTQTLYQNGVPRSARSFPTNSAIIDDYLTYNPTNDGYVSAIMGSIDGSGKVSGKINGGQLVVPPTTVKTTANAINPQITTADDVVVFLPEGTNNYSFHKTFNNVMVGDLLTVNYKNSDGYSSVVTSFIIKEVRCIWDATNPTYIVRINGKNLFTSTNAIATINRPYFNANKYGVLALAPVVSKSYGKMPGIIVGDPRGAQVLGAGFNPSQLGPNNYNLYLCMYPRSNPNSAQSNRLLFPVQIKPIDVTGNKGLTPGAYTLDHVVEQTNIALQKVGFNLRFIAFSHNGEFGIMLADPYNGVSFSIIAGALGSSGEYETLASNNGYPKNVIDVVNGIDPLGLGPLNANVASPPYAYSDNNPTAASKPTKIFTPLKRNSFYVNGAEKEQISSSLSALELDQEEDENGDGYWVAQIIERTPIPTGRVKVTYSVDKAISKADLKIGKTIVVQPISNDTGLVEDFGRFLIEDVVITGNQTTITVFDAVHNAGDSPYPTSQPPTKVRIYFSNNTILFSEQNVFDVNYNSATTHQYNRSFEIYADENGSVTYHERARFISSGSRDDNMLISSASLQSIDIVRVSPKLIGYEFAGSSVTGPNKNSSPLRKITLAVSSIDRTSGTYTGFLCRHNGSSPSNEGVPVTGKFGEVVRFYDESSINYIDFCFSLSNYSSIPASLSSTAYLDVQIFPTMSANQEIMLIGTLQLDKNNKISYLKDERQFGNVSEKQLSNSAISFIESSGRLLNENGVINGFDVKSNLNYLLRIAGGTCFVNGKVIQVLNSTISVPDTKIKGTNNFINWYLCADQNGKLTLIPSANNNSGTINYNESILNAYYGSADHYLYSSTLRNLINKRNDLLPLYVVYRDANQINIKDIRRFAYKQGSSGKITVSSEDGVGNFKSLDAAIEYARLQGSLEKEINIRSSIGVGSFGISGVSLDFIGIKDLSTINVNQQSYSISGSSAKEKIRFKNCSISFNCPVTVQNVEFIGCTINFAGSIANIIAETSFNDCTINIQSPISCLGSNINFENNEINVSSSTGINVSSDTKISNCTFNYNDTSVSGSPIINLNSALIYADVSGTIKNVTISNNKFNSGPSKDNTYPFVAFKLNSTPTSAAYASAIKITNNTFTSKFTSSYTAAIAIYSDGPTSNGISPTLSESTISDNTCNYDQAIIITDKTSNATCPILASNVFVKNNTCGIIGFLTSSSSSAKSSSLFISGNKVKLISNIDSSGKPAQYITASYSTGFVCIQKNTANWISVTSNSLDGYSEPVKITGNKITPADVGFFTNSGLNSGSSQIKNQGITYNLLGQSKNSCIISDNNLYKESSSATYYDAAIQSDGYSQILNNSIFGCVKNPSSMQANPIVSLGSTGGFIVSGNTINRNNLTVDCFIKGPDTSNTNKASITNNLLIGKSGSTITKDLPAIWYDSAKNTEW